MFSVSGTQTPCVGASIGIERVFTIIENKAIEKKLMGQSDIQVYIASIGDKTLSHRMRIARELWTANICSEYSHKENPKLKPQMDEVLERGIPFMIVFGEDEVEKGVVKVKNMDKHEEVEVQLGDLAAALMGQGCLQLSTSGNGLPRPSSEVDSSILYILKQTNHHLPLLSSNSWPLPPWVLPWPSPWPWPYFRRLGLVLTLFFFAQGRDRT